MKCPSIQRLVERIIFSKSFKAPRRKCGTLSDTIDISNNSVLQALSISIGMIPKVLPKFHPLTIK